MDMNRLPSESCWSHSCPLTCPTTSVAPAWSCFQTVRAHLQSNKPESLEPRQAQASLPAAKLFSTTESGLIWFHSILSVRLKQLFSSFLTTYLHLYGGKAIRKNASRLQHKRLPEGSRHNPTDKDVASHARLVLTL